jgi:hypothetical protein
MRWKHWNDCGHQTHLTEQLEGLEGTEGVQCILMRNLISGWSWLLDSVQHRILTVLSTLGVDQVLIGTVK